MVDLSYIPEKENWSILGPKLTEGSGKDSQKRGSPKQTVNGFQMEQSAQRHAMKEA